ncbi:MAG: alpha/beta hydrolase [Phycisphaerales bacterium]|jgi:acetyl esterase/lipase|nr:alpha/beta hydrolase [Phycisphaerales bacterium]
MTNPFSKPFITFVVMASISTIALARPSSREPLPKGTRVDRDVSYGSDPAQKMDVYSPQDAKDAPVIFMVHGGGWRRGDKAYPNVYTNKVAHWIPKGFIFISINYRMLPDANPIEQADDVAKALAYAQEHAKSWGADPARFILMGHSAGAHLVALITADPTIATHQGAKPWLGTIPLDSAAYDVVSIMEHRHFELYDQAFGKNRDFWEKASPTHRLKSATVPMLLVCSSRRILSQANAKAFAEKDHSLGGKATLLPQDLSHGQINAELGLPGAYTDKVDEFIHSLLSK